MKLGSRMPLGRVHVDGLGSGGAAGPGGRPPALVRPGSLAGGGGRPLELQPRGWAVLHGVINLLTQGSAGSLWRVTRCLAFCQPTNPLTRPEHALLTPRSLTLLTLQLKGLSRGRDVGGRRGPGRPCPRPGVSVQTHVPGQGVQQDSPVLPLPAE